MSGLARLSVAAVPAAVGSCELCATPEQPLASALVATHETGGAVQLVCCDRCGRAMRRVVAAIGAGAVVTTAAPAVAAVPAAAVVATAARAAPRASRTATTTMRELVMEYAVDVAGRDGRLRRPFAWGEGRADGTWVGWLEFVDPAGGPVLRTGQETSQPDRGALVYWASGLQPAYLEGALGRAH